MQTIIQTLFLLLNRFSRAFCDKLHHALPRLMALCLLSCCFNDLDAQVKLLVAGDSVKGYQAMIADGASTLVNEEQCSIKLYNLDRTVTVNLDTLKTTSWEGNEQRLTLRGKVYLPDFDAALSISINYEVVNQQTIKKQVSLFQPSIPQMYYILDERSIPAQKPSRYVSFEHENFPGGLVHEMFPAAGFITNDNKVVGFLTDAGYLNHYTRTTRRRYNGRGHGFVGMKILPDPSLLSIATRQEQEKEIDYIQYRFGEAYNLAAGQDSMIGMQVINQQQGTVEIDDKTGEIHLTGNGRDRPSIEFLPSIRDQEAYTISFKSKGNAPIALKFFRLKNGKPTIELEHGIKYFDSYQPSENEWLEFSGSIFTPYMEKDSVIMIVSSVSEKGKEVMIRDLKVVSNKPRKDAYNFLPLGDTVSKTTFIFVEPWKDHRNFMISSQTRLSEGKGFNGTQIEKMLYANFNMLTWIGSVNNFEPFSVPNMNYSPDMYNRDCFWTIVSTYNRTLNQKIWEQWGNTQSEEGGIATIITPYMGSTETKDNESTILWLVWAMLNKRRFGIEPPKEKIQKAIKYVLENFDEDRDGICFSHFPMSQIDIMDYNPKTNRLSVNQGMLVIALRTIRELGYDLSEEYIQKAEQGYRDFYDPKRKHILFDRNYPDIISLTDLEPEFLSLWLFNKPILTDEMVQQHLEQVPVLNKVNNSPWPELGTTAPTIIQLVKGKKKYSYLNTDYQPFGQFGIENYKGGKADGYYYNGGSWFRPEYCAYVTGLKHGWDKATKLMENRIWAEINLNPDWPFSKEFIPTKWTSTSTWWNSTKGLSWNIFILIANEVAGLRDPRNDPDFKEYPDPDIKE